MKMWLIKPDWSYRPATPPALTLPADALLLAGDGWRLRHDPSRMGAFRYESHGKTVEGCVGEACVVACNGRAACPQAAERRVKDNAPYQMRRVGECAPYLIDWGTVKPTVTRTKDGFTMRAETRDAEGRKWRLSRSFTKVEKGRALAIKTDYSCDRTQAFHVPYLTLFAERSSNGHKHQAMLAGLEYLDDEPSSNTKEIRMPESNRLIPALHRICAPFAALTDEKAWLAAEWEMPLKREYAVVFDTPDRQFKSGGHLLAFWFPAVGDARSESELDLYGSEPYSGGSQTVILRAGEGATVADALAALVRPEKLPPRDKTEEVATLALLSHGWLDSNLRDGTKVRHAIGFDLNQASDAPALGYLLKPDARYLKAARYWAYTGLSMVYLVPPPFTYPDGVDPFGCYATCGVMGATHWDLVSWMGRPVQWCGLVYSAALYDYIHLCKPEEAAFWRTIADGIVASGVRQSHPASEPDRQGLLPDSVYVDGQTRNPPGINPGDVQENLAEMLKSPYYALRAFPVATERDPPVLLHMAGDATDLMRKGNVLTCRIAAWPETKSRLVLTRLDPIASITLNGKPLAFSHDVARRIAVVTLPPRAEGRLAMTLK